RLPQALPALFQRVRRDFAPGGVGPADDLAWAAAPGGGVAIELRDRASPLAVRAGDAIGGRVAAADHDHVLAARGDVRLVAIDRWRGAPRDGAVTVIQV